MKKYSYIDVGNRLKELRKNLSQKEFSEKIGVPFRTYQRYESGETLPQEPVLKRVAEICNTTVDAIRGRGVGVITGEKEVYTRKEYEIMDMVMAVLRDKDEDNKRVLIDIIKTFYKTTKRKRPEDDEESGGHGMVGEHPRLDQSPELGGTSYLEDVG